MIVLYMSSQPRCKICYDKGKTQIVDIKSYNNKFDQGIGDVVGNEKGESTIIGVFVDKGLMYILLNNQIINITDKKVKCIIEKQGELKKFNLLVDDKVIFTTVYTTDYMIHDLLYGDNIEDLDFLSELSGILSSEESINKFITGFSKQK